jgi:hypothetical protein
LQNKPISPIFTISPTTLYTREALADALAPVGIVGADVDGWLEVVNPARRFKTLFLGPDILEAIRAMPPSGGPGREPAAVTRAEHDTLAKEVRALWGCVDQLSEGTGVSLD